MCGRYVSTSDPVALADYLRVDEIRTEALDASWNVAPTDKVYAAAETKDGERVLGTYQWGLVPHWAKDPSIGARMINARAETVAQKHGRALARRRCLLPADGFYEWEKKEKVRQPWFFSRADGAPMVFAGLWEVWGPDRDNLLRTCTIITTDANDLVGRIHDRMPVVLNPQEWELWLDRDVADADRLLPLLRPADARAMEAVEVTTRVNSVKNNGPELLEPLNSA